MQKLMTIMFAVFLSFTLLTPEADAGKRFGGGSSIGKSFSLPKKTTAPTATSSTTQQKAAAPTTAPRKPGFGGMLGGLLAGGLLAALFMGGAFEGMQIMDFLLIGLLAFAAFKLFAMFRRQNAPAYAGAGGAPIQGHADTAQSEPMARSSVQAEPVAANAAGAGFGAGLGDSEIETPQWFNRDAFVVGAQKHFSHLQKCWDEQNWDEIRSYVSPELFAELQAERGKQGAQKTEVVSVMAELAGFTDNKDHVVASINFYGWLKEDSDQTTEFSEVWHLMRDMSVENADWVIVGIEQP